MKYLFSIFLGLFLFPVSSFGNTSNYYDEFIECIHSVPGAIGVAGAYQQSDCVTYSVTGNESPVPFLSEDRTILYAYTANFGLSTLYLVDMGSVNPTYCGATFYCSISELASSEVYWILCVNTGDSIGHCNFPVYQVNSKFYLSWDEAFGQTASSTDRRVLGSLGFGIAIIIVLLSIFVVQYIYNKTTKKKPWLR